MQDCACLVDADVRHSGRVRSNGRVLGSVGARTSGLNYLFYRSFFSTVAHEPA